MVFNGKEFAKQRLVELKENFKNVDRKLTLAAILDPQNVAGAKYVQMKAKVAQELGVELKVYDSWTDEVNKADGIMVQLPYPNSSEVIKLIDPHKDIDGLREDSPYKPAVVRAILEILATQGSLENKKILVVGNKGFVGKRLVQELGCDCIDKDDFNVHKLAQADIVISATGQPGLIKSNMVKSGVVAIDVGYPQGDFDPEIAHKATLFTPVPGGVGPVTVVMLFTNLLNSK